MRRRTLLQSLAGASGAIRARAQTAAFPGAQAEKLRELARVVLPAGTDKVAAQFEQYVREYRPGADMDHGYGNTRIRTKPGALAPSYLTQLEALPSPVTKAAVEHALESVKDLPRLPDGKNVIADLMSFYFLGSDANDLCYRAAINRDRCRGLAGSDSPPPPLRGVS